MTRKELLVEIKRLRTEIALQPFGSFKIESLTSELIMVYDMYVERDLRLRAERTNKKAA